MLIGSLDGPMINGKLNRKGVAYYNGRTLRGAERFVYSAEKDFIWLDRNHDIKIGPDDLMASRKQSTPSFE